VNNPVLTQWLTQPDGLATQLRAMREAAGISGADLAADLGWTPSKVSRVQGGRILPTGSEVEAWCAACNAAGRAAHLVPLLEEARARHLPWRQRLTRGYRSVQSAYTELHRRATAIVMVEMAVIPGPLQTPGYARAMLEAVARLRPGSPAQDLDEAVEARRKRASFVGRPQRAAYQFLISEAALLGAPASPEVLADQLEHLLGVVDRGVDVRILPLRAGSRVVPVNSFALYTIDGQELVLVETFHGESEYTTNADVAAHHQALNWLLDEAATATQAAAIITTALQRLNT
jgi:transcriptional regulator with XRE-family HTH domain